jgi:hypothetical protein
MEIVSYFFGLENAERFMFTALILIWFAVQYILLRREYKHRQDEMAQSFKTYFKSKKPHGRIRKA